MDIKWSLKIGKVAGIPVSIHWTFIILLGWIFIGYYRIENDAQHAINGVFFIVALFVCVILHELGHALTAKRFKIVTKSITILPIGGLALMEKLPEKPIQELWVAIAGPVVNVVIAILLFIYLYIAGGILENINIEHLQTLKGNGFLLNLFIANIILAVFNLIPAFPMDGGRVLRALLAFKYERVIATKIAASIGQILAIFFIFFGIFTNIWLVFIGLFIFIGAGAEAVLEKTKSILAGYTVKDVLMHHYTCLAPDDTLGKAVQVLLDGYEQEFVITKENTVVGVLTKQELIMGLSEHGTTLPISNVMRKDFLILQLSMPLQEVYQKLMANKCSVAPVLKNTKLVGIIDSENINELIMVENALHNDSKQ